VVTAQVQTSERGDSGYSFWPVNWTGTERRAWRASQCAFGRLRSV